MSLQRFGSCLSFEICELTSGQVIGSENFFALDQPHYRHKASLDFFGSETRASKKSDNLPDPNLLAQEIIEDLEAALEQFREITAKLNPQGGKARCQA